MTAYPLPQTFSGVCAGAAPAAAAVGALDGLLLAQGHGHAVHRRAGVHRAAGGPLLVVQVRGLAPPVEPTVPIVVPWLTLIEPPAAFTMVARWA